MLGLEFGVVVSADDGAFSLEVEQAQNTINKTGRMSFFILKKSN